MWIDQNLSAAQAEQQQQGQVVNNEMFDMSSLLMPEGYLHSAAKQGSQVMRNFTAVVTLIHTLNGYEQRVKAYAFQTWCAPTPFFPLMSVSALFPC